LYYFSQTNDHLCIIVEESVAEWLRSLTLNHLSHTAESLNPASVSGKVRVRKLLNWFAERLWFNFRNSVGTFGLLSPVKLLSHILTSSVLDRRKHQPKDILYLMFKFILRRYYLSCFELNIFIYLRCDVALSIVDIFQKCAIP
jgi:hypothetical protein